MKPARFDYYRARSSAEAVSLLSEHGDEAKVLAGGQSLVPAMNFRLARPSVLVDVNPIGELDYVETGGNSLRIGSLARHSAFEQPVTDGPTGRLLQMASRHVGHLPIRVRGTFGGSLAHADPAAEWCVVALLLDAEMTAQSSDGTRTVSASDFFQTIFTTALQPQELLAETRLPLLPSTTRVGFTEFSRRAGDFALTMVATAVDLSGGTVASARVAFGGVSDRPLRAPETETALRGQELTEDVMEAASETAAAEVEPIGDIHGSAEYRRDLVRALTRRALQQVKAG
jgi:carbon-monoxide dehydrogenase medium subunit